MPRDGNYKGRPYGTVLRAKHYDKLHPMIQQLEDARIRKGWTQDRMDMEAGVCISTYRQLLYEGRNSNFLRLHQYAVALGMEWRLT